MIRSTIHRRVAAAAFALITAATVLAAQPVLASEPCNPPNVIPQHVCDMDEFYTDGGRQLPVGWSAFVLSGDPGFYQDQHTFFGGSNLTIRSTNPFKAGIYTRVPVTPGAGYRASISWGAPNAPDLFGRQLGIDPTGGTDPNAPAVIWGPMHWGEGRILNYPPPDVNIDVKARAVGDTLTVFFLTDHPQTSGDNLILIDVIALYPDESAPAVELPPTATPEPPTPEPVAEVAAAALAVATDTPTATPTATPSATPTATATSTPTATPTATATPTPSPTWTPWPSPTPEPVIAVVRTRTLDTARSINGRGGFIFLSLFSFAGAVIFGGSWFWLRRRR
ncbi:MAG: hypothetical protein H3C34_23070 [Caldilineaceae bacterium]|nr:hypothetical protein [Caldilineaceae bacterium]